MVGENKEHDAKNCEICKRLGDWASTPETKEWMDGHDKKGYAFTIMNGRIFETKSPHK
jgi:hypothetical protein